MFTKRIFKTGLRIYLFKLKLVERIEAMKKLICITLGILLIAASPSFAKTVRVRSSVTKSGQYRSAHYRTSPNKTKIDNWSTKGNVNPYTGKKGTNKPYKY